jgi:hypothetical protein
MENSTVKENGCILLNGIQNFSLNSTLTEFIDQCQLQNVGILGAEFYFPKSYVDQKELEKVYF